jgi:hypothetical protein
MCLRFCAAVRQYLYVYTSKASKLRTCVEVDGVRICTFVLVEVEN